MIDFGKFQYQPAWKNPQCCNLKKMNRRMDNRAQIDSKFNRVYEASSWRSPQSSAVGQSNPKVIIFKYIRTKNIIENMLPHLYLLGV